MMDMDTLVLNMLCEDISDISSDSSSSSLSSCDSSTKEISTPRLDSYKTSENYVDVVSKQDENQFRAEFGVSRRIFKLLTEQLRVADVLPTHGFGREKILPDKAIMITLRYLTHLETFRQISDRFQVSPSSVHRVLRKVMQFLVRLMTDHIHMPDEERASYIAQVFQEKYGLENVLGILDDCHIKIRRPAMNDELYRNKTDTYTIRLQAVVDCDRRFLDIYCGEPGSLAEDTVLEHSPLYARATPNHRSLFGNRRLIAGALYPSLAWLLTPTNQDESCEARLAPARAVASNAFSMLKTRFRRLISFENSNLKFILQCVSACCVLHNICLSNSDFVDENQAELSDPKQTD